MKDAETNVLEKCRRKIRARDLSLKTEESYLHSIAKFLAYFRGRDPKPPKEQAIAEFLTYH